MHTTSTYFSNFISRMRLTSKRIDQPGAFAPLRKSPVLSREELRSLILDMVG